MNKKTSQKACFLECTKPGFVHNRKGSTETMSFLIGIIIFIMIVVPIGIVIYHYMQSQTGMERTLNLLVERTSELEDGQKGSIVGYIEPGYIVLGFEKDSTSFGSNDAYWSCDTDTSEYGTQRQAWNIRKPSKCGKRACLCACSLTEGEALGVDLLPGDYLGPGACEGKICIPYDEDKDPRFIGGADCEYGPYLSHSVATLEISFERQGQTIGICEEAPCISKDVQKAREIYTEFYENYMQCKEYDAKDCLCEKTDWTGMPSDNVVQIRNDGQTTTFSLYDKDGNVRAKDSIAPDLFGRYERNSDDVQLKSSEDITAGIPSINPTSAEPIIRIPGHVYIDIYKSKAGNAIGIVRGGIDAFAGYKEDCSKIEYTNVAARVGQEGHCTYEENKEGICVKGTCDSPLMSEKVPTEGKGCGLPEYKCCAPIENMCQTAGGACKTRCAENEKRYEHEMFFDLDCSNEDKVCCMPAGTAPKSEYCIDNFGVCRDKCDILSETKTDKYSCDTGKCCMPSQSLFQNIQEEIMIPYLFNMCLGKCRAGCRREERGVKIVEYGTENPAIGGCTDEDVCCMKKCGNNGVCGYQAGCPEEKHMAQNDSECGREEVCCKVEQNEQVKGLPVFPCNFPGKCQTEACNEETQITALETLMCEDERQNCCINKAQDFPDTCSPAGGTCRSECNTAGGEEVIGGKTCPIELGNMRYCCKTVSPGATQCFSERGTCKPGPCNEETETVVTEVSCGTGKTCCKPKDDSIALIPSCTDVEGTCRRSPAAGEVLYDGATCEQANYYCFIPTPGGSECETKGNECKTLPCDHPTLAASYTAAHSYDASCGTGKYCCAKRQ